MKKFFAVAVLMIVLVGAFVSCGWNIEIVDPREPEEKEQDLSSVPEEIPQEEPKIKKGEPPISCENVVLETSGATIYKSLEFSDRIIIYYVEGNIAAFDIETGAEIYEYFLGDVNENGAFEMEKTNSKPGFDFCVYMIDKIVYLSSENPELIEEVPLPEKIAEDIKNDFIVDTYSVYETRIIWKSKDGIRLLDTETGEEKLLLPNEIIKTEIVPYAFVAIQERPVYIEDSGYMFIKPRFICGGEKIAVTVTGEHYLYWAAALYNIEKDEFEWSFYYDEMINADYPFADKYVSVGGRKYINAETGNYKNFDEFTRSADGINFFRCEFSDMDNHGFKIFMGDSKNIENGGTEFLNLTNVTATGHIENILENYLLIFVRKDGIEWDCIVKYK